MNSYFEKIINLKEADGFRNMIRRWQVLSDNMKYRPTDAPILLPDMLWVAGPGVGKTNMLHLMSEYLFTQGNLMEFYGDVKFFEFLLNYCPPGEPFTELHRLIDEVDNAAGFRSEYKGVIHIDIDEWAEHYEEKHFTSFMEYLSSNSRDWLIVLSVTPMKKEKLHNLTAFLAMYLRIEQLILNLPKTPDLFEFIQRRLGDYGLSLEDSARELLFGTVEALRKNRYFDGFKTIELLCQDVVYRIFSGGRVKHYALSAEDVKDFSADSEYVQRTVANIERVNRIGLLNKGN